MQRCKTNQNNLTFSDGIRTINQVPGKNSEISEILDVQISDGEDINVAKMLVKNLNLEPCDGKIIVAEDQLINVQVLKQ